MDEFLRENWPRILAAIAIAVALGTVWKLLRPRPKAPGEDIQINVKCRKCSWQGTLSRYNQVCPRCNSRDLGKF